MKVLLELAALFIGAAVLYTLMHALTLWNTRAGGPSRRGRRQGERALHAAEAALDAIEAKADLYRDVDSPLATEIRTILRAHRASRAGRNLP